MWASACLDSIFEKARFCLQLNNNFFNFAAGKIQKNGMKIGDFSWIKMVYHILKFLA